MHHLLKSEFKCDASCALKTPSEICRFANTWEMLLLRCYPGEMPQKEEEGAAI
jgi:hypothetical protein